MTKRDMNTGQHIEPGDRTCYYYLHTNGELIHKSTDYCETSFDESPFVRHYWLINLDNRADVWNFLTSAAVFGAKKERVIELREKWKMTDEDAQIYLEKTGLKWKVAEDGIHVHEPKERAIGFSEGIAPNMFDAIVDFYDKATSGKWR